jgi:hypothetical protein
VTRFWIPAAAGGLMLAATPAIALPMGAMPGMSMPAPAAKPAPKRTGVAKPSTRKRQSTRGKAVARKTSKPAVRRSAPAESVPVDHSQMDHSRTDHSAMTMPMAPANPVSPASASPATGTATPSAMDHGAMDHGTMAMPSNVQAEAPPSAAPVDHAAMGHDMAGMTGMTSDGGHAMKAALGAYPGTREASGTSWQPDTSRHMGVMTMAGDWMLMGHGVLNLVADTQGGPRGADKVFVSGMLMGMAQRPVGAATLQLRAMVSPDPFMGKRGYPVLLASGETADGTTRLIDRQHPHDLFMELSASLSQPIGKDVDAFVYAGLPGEPAFGPPAFMHRESIMESPEAPISHHWLDSTHISFGVITAGLVAGRAKLEISRFNGREPDQHRFNIETGPLDSTAVRMSWNPTSEWSLQGSWGHFTDPEQLEPGVDQKRLSASAIYTRDFADGTHWASTLAWGRKSADGHGDNAYVLESSVNRRNWTLFGRAEQTRNRELVDADPDHHGDPFIVRKASLGVLRDMPVGAGPLKLGVGVLGSVNFLPRGLALLYGGRNPLGAMAFIRLKVD